MTDLELYRQMLRIRVFEARLAARPDHGFQLFSSGEEAVAVGFAAAMRADDTLLSSGRSIGPALARGVPAREVMAELLGRTTGPCKGKAGRGHLSKPSAGFFGAHAVVAGNVGIATGVAMAFAERKEPRVVVVVFGDGASGAGIVHESMNVAAIFRLPIVFVCDNNQYSIATPATSALAAHPISDIARPFKMPTETVDGMDVLAVLAAAGPRIEAARRGEGPSFVECIAYRFATHSTSTRETRPAAELAEWRARCPIVRLQKTLDPEAVAAIDAEIATEVTEAIAFAEASPFPDASALLEGVDG